MSEHDPVNHPKHYTQHPSGIETIEVTEHFDFCIGNAMKYLWRAGLKGDAIEDLEKARWYVDREIARLRKEREKEQSNKENSLSDLPDNAEYICEECASELGGTWPEWHVATFHTGVCDGCKKETSLSNVGDWNWPDGKRRGMRD
jgi:hypothetical protein